MPTTKYGNKPFWLNKITNAKADKIPSGQDPTKWEHWDSELEWRIYVELLKRYPKEFITRQRKVLLLPPSEHFKAVTWTVDFEVTCYPESSFCGSYLIEGKGKWLLSDDAARQAFQRTIAMFAYTNPRWYPKLLIVDNTPWKISSDIKVLGIKDLNSRILQLPS